MEGQRAERGVAAGAAAGDREPARIRLALRDQKTGRSQAVEHVDLAPAAVQALAIGAPVAGAAAVVDVAHRKAARGPELGREAQLRRGAAGRPAMALDDQRRQFARRRAVIGIGRRIVERMDERAALAATGDRLGPRQIARVDRQIACGAQLRHAAGCRIEQDDRRRPVRAAGAQDGAAVRHGKPRELGVGQRQTIERSRLDLDPAEVPAAVLAEAGEDRVRSEKGVGAHAERPGRSGEFGRHRADGHRALADPPGRGSTSRSGPIRNTGGCPAPTRAGRSTPDRRPRPGARRSRRRRR